MEYLTKEQKIVVEARIGDGYEIIGEKPNGNIMVVKGRHTMEINCLGYDCYVPLYKGLS